MTRDVRWRQRFDNYQRALTDLSGDVALRQMRQLSRLEEKGLIQSFEMVHELAWNVLKDYLEEVAGTMGLLGSKDTTREAFRRGLIEEGELWMQMIQSRNLTSHVYDENTARAVAEDIASRFHPAFVRMHQRFLQLGKNP